MKMNKMKRTLLACIIVVTGFGFTSCEQKQGANAEVVTKNSAMKEELPTLNDLVKEESNIKTFLVALDSAKMSWVLRQDNDAYILFAPTDEAFALLGDEAVANLLLPENRTTLFNLVRNHIVKGRVPSSMMTGGMSAETESRTNLVFEENADGTKTVNGAKFVKTDIEGSNGIVHIIDRVIE
jgi:transforming growth factor-beta-induced protein